MDTNVKLEKNCARCGKQDEQSMNLEDAKQAIDERTARDTARDELMGVLDELTELHPDIVIAVRSEESGEYAVKTMDREQLCHAPNAKRNRGCRSAVERILGDLLMVPKDKPKATAKTPPTQSTTEDTDVGGTDSK